jgi:hypothetical protein
MYEALLLEFVFAVWVVPGSRRGTMLLTLECCNGGPVEDLTDGVEFLAEPVGSEN